MLSENEKEDIDCIAYKLLSCGQKLEENLGEKKQLQC